MTLTHKRFHNRRTHGVRKNSLPKRNKKVIGTRNSVGRPKTLLFSLLACLRQRFLEQVCPVDREHQVRVHDHAYEGNVVPRGLGGLVLLHLSFRRKQELHVGGARTDGRRVGCGCC